MTAAIPEPSRESVPSAAPAGGQDQRFARLADGVRKIRTGAKRLKFDERSLMIIGGVIAPLGFVLVLVGWYGAAHSPYLFQQIPYLISGGLLGLGLVFLGGFFYFAHWVTELVKEQRRQTSEVVDALARLEAVLQRAQAPAGNGQTNGHANGAPVAGTAQPAVGQPDAPLDLVATMRGTVAHRPECVVVAGKVGVRSVVDGERLGACRLCDPYDSHAERPV